jgi:hypothetical protein
MLSISRMLVVAYRFLDPSQLSDFDSHTTQANVGWRVIQIV